MVVKEKRTGALSDDVSLSDEHTLPEHVRRYTPVVSQDGAPLGHIVQIWRCHCLPRATDTASGADDDYIAVALNRSWWKRWLAFTTRNLYVPARAIDPESLQADRNEIKLRYSRQQSRALFSELPDFLAGLVVPKDKRSYLQVRIDDLSRRKENRERFRKFMLFISAFIMIVVILSESALAIHNPTPLSWFLIPVAVLSFSLISLLFTFVIRPPHELELEIVRLENEADLLSDPSGESRERDWQRAEKLFRLNQLELDKYYRQTLRHSAWIFAIGLICLAFGFAIIGATLYTVINLKAEPDVTKIVTAVLGGISSILSSFIGAVYLRMYSDTVKSLTEFHQRLVAANRLHFGNLLVEKISEEPLHHETLAAMARQLAGLEAAATQALTGGDKPATG